MPFVHNKTGRFNLMKIAYLPTGEVPVEGAQSSVRQIQHLTEVAGQSTGMVK